jgi:hypothetical protein
MDRQKHMKVNGAGSVGSVSVPECLALRILHNDGWTVDEICMTFMVGETAARRHISRDCQHPDAD